MVANHLLAANQPDCLKAPWRTIILFHSYISRPTNVLQDSTYIFCYWVELHV